MSPSAHSSATSILETPPHAHSLRSSGRTRQSGRALAKSRVYWSLLSSPRPPRPGQHPAKDTETIRGWGGKGRATAKSGLLACHLTSCCVTISKSLTLTLASWSVTRRLALYVCIRELSAFGDTLRQSV